MPLTINTKALVDRLRKNALPQEIVAVDFSQAEARCARLRHVNGKIHLVAADILPQIQNVAETGRPEPLALSKQLGARNVALCLPAQNAIVKLLNIPGHFESGLEDRIKEDMGVGAGDFRIGYKVLGTGHARPETKLLTVAVPEKTIQQYLAFFASGWPVPIAIELSGLAAISAFCNGYMDDVQDDSAAGAGQSWGVVQIEDSASFFAFIFKKELVLIRKYDFGSDHILGAIQSRLNVNRETAMNVAADQSFDISQMIREVCDGFVRQLVISKHFVERRENCQVTKIFIPGNAAAAYRLAHEIHVASEVEVEFWDPLRTIVCGEEAIAPRLREQKSSLASVIGTAIGFFGGAE